MTGIEALNIYAPNTSGAITQSSALSTSEWYNEIIFYLKLGKFHVGMSSKERKSLKMKTNSYVLVSGVLF
jgi:hypothetical protein